MTERKRGGSGRSTKGRKAPGAAAPKQAAAEATRSASVAQPAQEAHPVAANLAATPQSTENPVLAPEETFSPTSQAAPEAGDLVVSSVDAAEQQPGPAAVEDEARADETQANVAAVAETGAVISEVAHDTALEAAYAGASFTAGAGDAIEGAARAVQATTEVAVEAARSEAVSAGETGAALIAEVPSAVEAAAAPLAAVAEAGAEAAGPDLKGAAKTGDALRQAMTDSFSATTRGLIEINGKVVEMVRASSEANLDLWRATFTAGSLPEAVRAQADGLRRACERTAEHWQDLAQTTTRIVGEAWQPLQTAWIIRR